MLVTIMIQRVTDAIASLNSQPRVLSNTLSLRLSISLSLGDVILVWILFDHASINQPRVGDKDRETAQKMRAKEGEGQNTVGRIWFNYGRIKRGR